MAKPNIPRAIGNELSTTLSASVTNIGLSITLNNATGWSTSGGYAIIDRDIASKEEVVYIESITGSTATISSDGRGLGDTSAVAHDIGATIEDILVADHINGFRTSFLLEHNDDGSHKQIAAAIVVSGNAINSTNKAIAADSSASGQAISTTNKVVDQRYYQAVEGQLMNGKIVPTVVANALVLSIKTFAGNDPSTSDPVEILVGNTIRQLVAALSVTLAASTQMNLSATEHVGTEQDLFAYIGFNATDGLTLAASRYSTARKYADFSATATNEKYAKISTITTAASTDPYVNIGRFAATLDASNHWVIPTYDAANLIQSPITRNRGNAYVPTAAGWSGTPTVSGFWWMDGNRIKVLFRVSGTSNSTGSTISMPWLANTLVATAYYPVRATDAGVSLTAPGLLQVNTSSPFSAFKDLTGANWTASGAKVVDGMLIEFFI